MSTVKFLTIFLQTIQWHHRHSDSKSIHSVTKLISTKSKYGVNFTSHYYFRIAVCWNFWHSLFSSLEYTHKKNHFSHFRIEKMVWGVQWANYFEIDPRNSFMKSENKIDFEASPSGYKSCRLIFLRENHTHFPTKLRLTTATLCTLKDTPCHVIDFWNLYSTTMIDVFIYIAETPERMKRWKEFRDSSNK